MVISMYTFCKYANLYIYNRPLTYISMHLYMPATYAYTMLYMSIQHMIYLHTKALFVCIYYADYLLNNYLTSCTAPFHIPLFLNPLT